MQFADWKGREWVFLLSLSAFPLLSCMNSIADHKHRGHSEEREVACLAIILALCAAFFMIYVCALSTSEAAAGNDGNFYEKFL